MQVKQSEALLPLVLGKLCHSCTHMPFKSLDRGLHIDEARADSMGTLGMVSSAALS